MPLYSKEILKYRQCRRAAVVLHGHWEEKTGVHSRIFESLVADWLVEDGESVKGKDYREHIVPCSLMRDECIKLFDAGYSVEGVTHEIMKHLRIVRIHSDEAKYIDHELGLKTRMPDGWTFGKDDPLARLRAGNIILKEDVET